MSEMIDPEEALARTERQTADATEEDTERLPPVTTLSIDCKDGRGNKYKHEFYFRCPTLGMRKKMGDMKLLYFPTGSPPDMTAEQLVHVICYLTVCIQFNEKFKKPHWWDFWNLYDATPFTKLYQEATRYESRFLGSDEDAERDEASGGEEEAADGGDGGAAVGRKVRPPAERRETLTSHGA